VRFLALKMTGTLFSASSALGLLALMGVSVENRRHPGLVHQQIAHRRQRHSHGTREAFTVTATPHHDDRTGCLFGALARGAFHGIGSDTQKPFAIVIVAGLVSRLFLGFFVNPVLYEMVAHDGDVLQV